MILEKQTEGLILEEGGLGKSSSMEIDADSHIFLMRMLSKFYSDSIGSLIRETASNALDSHRQAGIVDPIVVSLLNTSGNYEFSVEDFGTGIDDIIVDTVIRKYGKSTKRQNKNALGAFGLGFKSPLAYSPSFCFIGRKGGIERKWMMYEAEDDENKIDLLYEKPTTERDGVKVVVPVKYGDYHSFVSKIQEQLCYFEHVYFNCPDIDNNFEISRSQHYQYSSLCNDHSLHICLDNVYYPIDWAKLGKSDIVYLPVGLRFSLSDGIFPLPNRETIKYTEEAKRVILDKISLLADHFIQEYNKSVTDSEDIRVIFNHLASGTRVIKHTNGQVWSLESLPNYSKIKFKDPELKSLKYVSLGRIFTMRDSLVKCYKKTHSLRNGRFSSEETRGYERELRWYNIDENIYIYSDTIPKKKKDYLRDTLGKKSAIFVKFNKDFPLKSNTSSQTSYISLLNLGSVPKTSWRDHIKEFQRIRSMVTSNFIDLDKIEIPKEWFEEKKKKRVSILTAKGITPRRKKLTGEVTGKEAKRLERYVSGKNCKFEPIVIQMAEAHKNKKFTIYGSQDQEPRIQKWFTVLRADSVRFVVFSEREIKNLKDLKLHNWITMDEFEKGEHIIFKRAVTAYLIDQLMSKNTNTFNKLFYIKAISTDLFNKLTELSKYKTKYHIRGDQNLYEDMVKVAESNNLFDPTIYSLYKEIKNTLEKLPFLNNILKLTPYGDPTPEIVDALKDLFKYYKMRIDWIHYNVKLNTDPGEEVLSEGKFEELEATI